MQPSLLERLAFAASAKSLLPLLGLTLFCDSRSNPFQTLLVSAHFEAGMMRRPVCAHTLCHTWSYESLEFTSETTAIGRRCASPLPLVHSERNMDVIQALAPDLDVCVKKKEQ